MAIRLFLRAGKRVYQRAIHLAPLSAAPYATHLPILCAMSLLVRPRRVVEYGSGTISTPAFLDRAAFPELEALVSYENNAEWFVSVRERVGLEARAHLRMVEGPIHKAVACGENLDTADLVFVDDSDAPGRAATIRALAATGLRSRPVVIHDLELIEIRRAAGAFQHVFRFDALRPQTGVAWNGDWPGSALLADANRLIRERAAAIAPEDISGWRRALRQGLSLR